MSGKSNNIFLIEIVLFFPTVSHWETVGLLVIPSLLVSHTPGKSMSGVRIELTTFWWRGVPKKTAHETPPHDVTKFVPPAHNRHRVRVVKEVD